MEYYLGSSEMLYPCIGAALALTAYMTYRAVRSARRRRAVAAVQQLVHGAETNDLPMVQAALAQGAALDVLAHSVKKQPIHFAAQHNSMEVLQYLIQRGAALDATDMAKMTPLHYAAMKGRTGAAKMLIKSGCNVLQRDMADYTGLHFAALNGHAAAAEVLLDAGVGVDDREKMGQTALMLAACKNKLDVVELLLDRGADRFLRGKNNVTALDYAHKKRSSACIDLLEGRQRPRARPKASKPEPPARQADKPAGGSKFDNSKAMSPPKEGEPGWRPAAASKPNKLEQLVKKHEAETSRRQGQNSNQIAAHLKNKGYDCVSAFDKDAAKKAIREFTEAGGDPELAEHLKELGLDKLE